MFASSGCDVLIVSCYISIVECFPPLGLRSEWYSSPFGNCSRWVRFLVVGSSNGANLGCTMADPLMAVSMFISHSLSYLSIFRSYYCWAFNLDLMFAIIYFFTFLFGEWTLALACLAISRYFWMSKTGLSGSAFSNLSIMVCLYCAARSNCYLRVDRWVTGSPDKLRVWVPVSSMFSAYS